MTAIAVKASVAALKAFPHFNSSLDAAAGELILKQYFHIGVAVDTPHGLLVPVIRDADRKTIVDIAGELTDLATRARDRKLALDEMQGASFTITNLGGIGGTAFTPIVNLPEVAILGLSRSRTELRPGGRRPQERVMLPLSLSYDHRIINGADAARFVAKLAKSFADCFTLLIEC
jgi:pyruvate dehydrogenase E2 component (dihydrolipoamide acetyltransferase)